MASEDLSRSNFRAFIGDAEGLLEEGHHVVDARHVPLAVGATDDGVPRSWNWNARVVQDVTHPNWAGVLEVAALDVLLHFAANLLADLRDGDVDL
jgi:hypothetical protein